MALSEDKGLVDVGRMSELFRLGTRDLLEVWSLILPPATLFELRKLASLPQDQFRMPDGIVGTLRLRFCAGTPPPNDSIWAITRYVQ